MSDEIDMGAHAAMHSIVGGAMFMHMSPGDPLFWSHHAMVDLLHVIFHQCRVGTERMSFQEKATHLVAWATCSRRNGRRFNPTDEVLMRIGGGRGQPVIAGSEDPVIGRFFKGVPTQNSALMDAQDDLGDSSYSYELDGLPAPMQQTCGRNGDRDRGPWTRNERDQWLEDGRRPSRDEFDEDDRPRPAPAPWRDEFEDDRQRWNRDENDEDNWRRSSWDN